jgi:hypothetical protein
MLLNKPLALSLENLSLRTLPDELRGKCCAPLLALTETKLTALLQDAAMVRLQSKAAQFPVRARQAGWEKALWEGLFRGLGCKHDGPIAQTGINKAPSKYFARFSFAF